MRVLKEVSASARSRSEIELAVVVTGLEQVENGQEMSRPAARVGAPKKFHGRK